ncbi:hypothetical protein ALQ74_103146 [Pseudomonas savastanoi pv. glycinea]|uniref:Uncharacterized protein n=2 Tax=Pseudomonas savastanoi TaxID=29438 RepID=A0A3M4MHR7_PSESG|nr:Unknown protein sequence [Pseudomonas savastanoi pv. phaseolicola]RMM64594.1 hypothetical protein ALQ74_103146 [Pseudomonas savastanoi pv. glycinea]KPB48802.1 Unknown protein sequence [Pseudomonas savastanoi pv. phaseolicola]KPY20772.1 hypothetical protein ALO55_103078 [Pseudomonas savastanoi pv. phaseolicola]RMQ49657.1 hypothetical protein ALQ02_102644 [Pseudomonas savastanoi pv. phaseolicola]
MLEVVGVTGLNVYGQGDVQYSRHGFNAGRQPRKGELIAIGVTMRPSHARTAGGDRGGTQ